MAESLTIARPYAEGFDRRVDCRSTITHSNAVLTTELPRKHLLKLVDVLPVWL